MPMTNKLDWNTYLDRLPTSPRDNQIAAAANIAPSTVSRWRGGQDPRPAHAVAVARAFDLHPFSALTAAGYLSDAEIDALLSKDVFSELSSFENFTTASLAAEVARRLNRIEG